MLCSCSQIWWAYTDSVDSTEKPQTHTRAAGYPFMLSLCIGKKTEIRFCLCALLLATFNCFLSLRDVTAERRCHFRCISLFWIFKVVLKFAEEAKMDTPRLLVYQYLSGSLNTPTFFRNALDSKQHSAPSTVYTLHDKISIWNPRNDLGESFPHSRRLSRGLTTNIQVPTVALSVLCEPPVYYDPWTNADGFQPGLWDIHIRTIRAAL